MNSIYLIFRLIKLSISYWVKHCSLCFSGNWSTSSTVVKCMCVELVIVFLPFFWCLLGPVVTPPVHSWNWELCFCFLCQPWLRFVNFIDLIKNQLSVSLIFKTVFVFNFKFSALVFAISYLLLALSLFCSFSVFLRWEFGLFIWSFPLSNISTYRCEFSSYCKNSRTKIFISTKPSIWLMNYLEVC